MFTKITLSLRCHHWLPPQHYRYFHLSQEHTDVTCLFPVFQSSSCLLKNWARFLKKSHHMMTYHQRWEPRPPTKTMFVNIFFWLQAFQLMMTLHQSLAKEIQVPEMGRILSDFPSSALNISSKQHRSTSVDDSDRAESSLKRFCPADNHTLPPTKVYLSMIGAMLLHLTEPYLVILGYLKRDWLYVGFCGCL